MINEQSPSNGAPPVAAEPIDERSLTDKLGLWLRMAHKTVVLRVNDLLDRYELQQIHYLIMGLVRDNPGCRQISIAHALQMKQPNVAKIMEMLVDRDLVVRRPDSLDRRANRITLTEDGERCLSEIEIEYQRLQASLLSVCDTALTKNLFDMLKRLANDSTGAADQPRLHAPRPHAGVAIAFFDLAPGVVINDDIL